MASRLFIDLHRPNTDVAKGSCQILHPGGALINPLAKAPHQPGRGMVIDKLVINPSNSNHGRILTSFLL